VTAYVTKTDVTSHSAADKQVHHTTHTAAFTDHVNVSTMERKGKKSIYIAPFTVMHSKRSGVDHTVLPANNTMPAFPSYAFTRWHHHSNWGSRHPIAAHSHLL